jgi:hypothetical protein
MFSGVGGVVEPPTFILAQEAKDAGVVQDCVEGQIAKEFKPQQHEHDLLETPDRQFLARYLHIFIDFGQLCSFKPASRFHDFGQPFSTRTARVEGEFGV